LAIETQRQAFLEATTHKTLYIYIQFLDYALVQKIRIEDQTILGATTHAQRKRLYI